MTYPCEDWRLKVTFRGQSRNVMYNVIRVCEVEKKTCPTITLTKAILDLNGSA
jgi:hypothetical protein